MRIVLSLFVALGSMSCMALFREQLGEYDWLHQGVGVPTRSLIFSNQVLVSTDASVVASLDAKDGSIGWRIVLPGNASVKGMVLGEAAKGLFVYVEESDQVSSVKCINISSGSLYWEQSFLRRAAEVRVDMFVDEAKNRLNVLSGNQVFFLSMQSGTRLWSWEPERGDNTVLHSLVASSTFLSNEIIALGFSNAKAVLVTASSDAKSCSIQQLASFGNTSELVSMLVLPGGSTRPDDVIVLGVSGSEVRLAYATKSKTTKLPFPTSMFPSAPLHQVDGLLLVDAEKNRVSAVVTRCGVSYCEVYQVVDVDTSSPGLKPILACNGTLSAQVAFERLAAHYSLANHVSCISVSKGVVNSSMQLTFDVFEQNGSEFLLNGEGFKEILRDGLSMYRSSASKTSADDRHTVEEDGLRFLLSTSSGSVLMVRAGSLAWRREESLASVMNAVLLDGTGISHHAAEHHLLGTGLLALTARLTLQMDDLRDLIQKFVSGAPKTMMQLLQNMVGTTNVFARELGGNFQNTASTLTPVAKSRAQASAKRFGFDKRAVCLCNGPHGIVLLGLDLMSKSALWVLDVGASLPFGVPVTFSKLLTIGKNEIALVLSTKNASYVFAVDVQTGASISNTSPQRIQLEATRSFSRVVSLGEADLLLSAKVLSVMQHSSSASATKNGKIRLLRLIVEDSLGRRSVADYPQFSNVGVTEGDMLPEFVHYLDKITGVLQTYQLQAMRADEKLRVLQPIASAVFEPKSEKIVTVVGALPGDPVHSRYTTLGDDSLLLKYLNTHVMLIASVSPPDAAEAYFSAQEDRAAAEIRLHLTLVDVVSAKVIYRGSLESATAPVHAIIVENSIVVTFWNAKAKRCEMSSIALFEGVIDRYGLSPFAPKQSAAAAGKAIQNKNFSSFASTAPLAMQKTYVIPKAVTAFHHTVTTQGIANKNLLVGLSSGQVYAVDARQISPRRPLTETSPAEREEGLGLFQPFAQLLPLQAVTHNYALGSEPRGIHSSPSRLESSSLVLVYGRPDLHFNRVIPSGGFDLLASDFNHSLLSVLLLLLGFLVHGLRMLASRKALRQAWS